MKFPSYCNERDLSTGQCRADRPTVVFWPSPGLREEPTSSLGASGGTYNAEGLCTGPCSQPPSSPPGTMEHCGSEGPLEPRIPLSERTPWVYWTRLLAAGLLLLTSTLLHSFSALHQNEFLKMQTGSRHSSRLNKPQQPLGQRSKFFNGFSSLPVQAQLMSLLP